MSAEPVPTPSTVNSNFGTSSFSSSGSSSRPLWDKLSTWAAEHKAVVYTIAGVAVVATGAGAIYYFSDSGRPLQDLEGQEKKRLSKKERRKAKQEKGKEQPPTDAAAPQTSKDNSRTAKVESDDGLDGIPEINESSVETLLSEVSYVRALYLQRY